MLPFWSDHYDVLESSNTWAQSLIEARNLPREKLDYRVIVCAEQTKGRGTGERTWVSEKGNLFLSFLLPMSFCEGNVPGPLSLATSVAVAHWAQQYVPYALVSLKWPNDILLDRKKMAGILLEVKGAYVVVGLGVNILYAPQNIPETTCLNAYAKNVPAHPLLLNSLLQHVSFLYETLKTKGFSPLKQEWQRLCSHRNQLLEIAGKQGVFVGLGDQGEMILKEKGQKKILVSCGEQGLKTL
ncbi:biotin--[acetyl-CoA-carboxylase] ligase [Alphaproteobacteria bacterium]|nr:biotin--[acetyl-CoA-carboxylase] ligase [Alphaproteobacteria bacterium]GHS96357.1 biotin--[acetyl-CoA-carboxylase] ligase [Alphaproteobacteria bacterium]